MNEEELIKIRRENYDKLDNFSFRHKRDAIELNRGHTPKTNFAKVACWVLIKNGVPANLLPEIVPKLFREDDTVVEHNIALMLNMIPAAIKAYGRKFKHVWEVPEIVMEAKHKRGTTGDWDLYILDTGERIEIVDANEKAVKPYDEKTIVVRI